MTDVQQGTEKTEIPIKLVFTSGMTVGGLIIPDPDVDPSNFSKVAHDIGFHIALSIHGGETGVLFQHEEDSN